MITGLSAYQAVAGASYLRVTEARPSSPDGMTVSDGSVGSPGRVIQDVVTLSPAAQAYLDYLAAGGGGASTVSQFSSLSGHANLIGANLSYKNFRGDDLSGAFLFGANLTGAVFDYANLQNAWMAGTDLSGASFNGADLRGANLDKATGLTSEQLAGAIVNGNTLLPIAVTTVYSR
ncbi:MAG: pentapeptide repeat-containing protein [Rhodospirillales bacterium]|nr:pentapeptide repeat-containing protein [Rhodospirillales bacterium]MCW9001376.1 pentapeptide repeat-containing protein [Rhodospirillales bacterium]MCW9039869.1 pentapeptide repeat-containing protein [Rhodospirillales bacterium]